MRALAFALALAAPALALDIVELKDGRVLEVEAVSVSGDKLRVQLATPPGQHIAYTIPVEKVVPEYVYYAWAAGIPAADVEGHKALAAWARTQGLFKHAWKSYEAAAEHSASLKARMGDLGKEMHEEEATWNFTEAERLFREGDVATARYRVERILGGFADTKEAGRAEALLSIIIEREQFLSEQKIQEEIAKRARKQRRAMDKQLARIGKADEMVLKARLDRPAYAIRRLEWAAFAYRGAALEFSDLLPEVEVDDLRLTLKALLEDLEHRIARTFVRLADIRFVVGDIPGSLDAVHEVLAVDPDNKHATGLRERILDGGTAPAPATVVPVSYRLYGGYRVRLGSYPHAYPYPRRVGIHPCGSVYRVSFGGHFGLIPYR